MWEYVLSKCYINSMSVTKRALLVGVGDYKNAWLWDTRPANKKDVEIIKNLLLLKFAFDESNVTILTGNQATKSAIIDQLRNIVSVTERQDVAVFAFSGHGGRFHNDKKLNEFNETLVPYEANGSKETHISDTELCRLLEEFRSPNVTVILDSCYSGGATRGRKEVIFISHEL